MEISASIFRLQLILSWSCVIAFLLNVRKFLPTYATLFSRDCNLHKLLSVYQKESKQHEDRKTNLFINTEFSQKELGLTGYSANVDGGNAKRLPENGKWKGSLKELITDGRYLSGSGRGQILGVISFLKASSFSLCPQMWQEWSAANKKFRRADSNLQTSIHAKSSREVAYVIRRFVGVKSSNKLCRVQESDVDRYVVKLVYVLLLCSDRNMRLIDLQSTGEVWFMRLLRAQNNDDFEP